jgi:hypothetical protein
MELAHLGFFASAGLSAVIAMLAGYLVGREKAGAR